MDILTWCNRLGNDRRSTAVSSKFMFFTDLWYIKVFGLVTFLLLPSISGKLSRGWLVD